MAGFSSLWLELAMVGLLTAWIRNRRLSVGESPELCAIALAAPGRTAMLATTCDASASGWASLVRAALREPAPDPGAYRDAPRRLTSESFTRLVAAERRRIQRTRAIALGGGSAAIVGAAMLLEASPAPMGLTVLLAVIIGWRAGVNGRRAFSALDAARDALPEVVARLPPPPAPVVAKRDPGPVPVRTSDGCLAALFSFGFGLIVLVLAAGLVSEATARVPAKQIGVLFGVHIMLLVFVVPLLFLLPRVRARLDLNDRA